MWSESSFSLDPLTSCFSSKSPKGKKKKRTNSSTEACPEEARGGHASSLILPSWGAAQLGPGKLCAFIYVFPSEAEKTSFSATLRHALFKEPPHQQHPLPLGQSLGPRRAMPLAPRLLGYHTHTHTPRCAVQACDGHFRRKKAVTCRQPSPGARAASKV